MIKILNKNFHNSLCYKLLLFLACYSFSVGLFDNYRVLWLSEIGISTISISRIITVGSIVTALSLLFFSLKVSPSKLKNGITVSLILKLIIGTLLICFRNTSQYFLIKFLMFFDIALMQLVLSAIYPFMMTAYKSDLLYTKREAVESIASKLGFFLVSFLLGKSFGSFLVDYNACFLFSIIFLFFSFMIFLNISVSQEKIKETKEANLNEAFHYFNNHKILYLSLLISFVGNIAWSIITSLKMLTLTEILGFDTKGASYFILILGILTNILALVIVKYFNCKNDYIAVFLKYGSRSILYLGIFLTGDQCILLVTMTFLLLTDSTFNYVITGYFINHIQIEYTLIYTVLKYSSSLLGDGIGTFLCGLTFHMPIRYIGLYSFIFGLITYILANILVKKKKRLNF